MEEMGVGDTVAVELSFMIFIILGRWILPRGKISHSALSQLLLVYLSLASDILDLLTLFNEKEIYLSGIMVKAVLSTFSVCMLQFALNLTATRGRSFHAEFDQTEIEIVQPPPKQRQTGKLLSKIIGAKQKQQHQSSSLTRRLKTANSINQFVQLPILPRFKFNTKTTKQGGFDNEKKDESVPERKNNYMRRAHRRSSSFCNQPSTIFENVATQEEEELPMAPKSLAATSMTSVTGGSDPQISSKQENRYIENNIIKNKAQKEQNQITNKECSTFQAVDPPSILSYKTNMLYPPTAHRQSITSLNSLNSYYRTSGGTSGLSKISSRKSIADSVKVFVKQRSKKFLRSEIWSILVTVSFQDGPFFAIRLIAIFVFKVESFLTYFFTFKNLLIFVFQTYRITAICVEKDEKEQEFEEKLDTMRRMSVAAIQLGIPLNRKI
ncbi:unnamed protein product [Didymodactylos carnosus]|uniref:Uncharacterized protein n=1 Tax=Didymodactylos carnosus TaxID=1234261 RepID=A0A814CI68_9BILA|nr:unnamed protein product [Didymodactylos carnosus]CAF1193883.1 unnamed protein product [Didymodactylos carnosus]CAF3719957.1 unnamed protein product [Didymodactylos carnosus]CAF4004176.1 unnamed protein product [Didymodactylos carnosus]